MMTTRSTSLSLAGLIVASFAAASPAALATPLRVCTFPGSPTAALDTSVARAAFRVAGVPAVFGGHGIKDGNDDDGVSANELARSLKHDCDVIFMASHGRRGLEGLLVGSETQKVLTHCRIPVLVYR